MFGHRMTRTMKEMVLDVSRKNNLTQIKEYKLVIEDRHDDDNFTSSSHLSGTLSSNVQFIHFILQYVYIKTRQCPCCLKGMGGTCLFQSFQP